MATRTKKTPTAKTKTPMDELTEEQTKFLVEKVMNYPQGSASCKRKWLEDVGLPPPPQSAMLTINISIPITTKTHVKDGYITKSGFDAATKLLDEIVLPEGVTIDKPVWGSYRFVAQ